MNKSLSKILLLSLILLTINKVQSSEETEDFQLEDIHEKNFAISDFKGKVIVLEFFATYCSTCKPQVEELKMIRSTYPEDTLVIISIRLDPSPDTNQVLRNFADNASINWILARDTIGISDKYSITIAPTIFILDKLGVIRYKHAGLTKIQAMQPTIDQLISETPQVIISKPTADGNITPAILLIVFIALALSLTLILRKRRTSKKKFQKSRTSMKKGTP